MIKNLSIPGVQFSDPKYWDEESFFTTSQQQKTASLTTTAENHKGIKPHFSLERVDGLFALLLLCFLSLACIYKGRLVFFKENISFVLFSRKNINQLGETTASEFWYNFILVFQFLLMSSIFLFILFQKSDNTYIPPNSFLTLLMFILAISLFGTLKYLFYKLAGFIFDIQTSIKKWIRSYIIMLEIMGLIAFLPILFLVYANYWHGFLIIFLITLFAISRLIIIYRITLFFFQEKVNFLFSIAYLCSVEIIPYFLLYKVLLYLYKIDIISLTWL